MIHHPPQDRHGLICIIWMEGGGVSHPKSLNKNGSVGSREKMKLDETYQLSIHLIMLIMGEEVSLLSEVELTCK